jgi:hypothetical protein
MLGGKIVARVIDWKSLEMRNPGRTTVDQRSHSRDDLAAE